MEEENLQASLTPRDSDHLASTDQGTYAQLSPTAGEHFLQNAKGPALPQHIGSPTDPYALLLEGPPPVLPGLALRALLHFQNIPHVDPEFSPPFAAHIK